MTRFTRLLTATALAVPLAAAALPLVGPATADDNRAGGQNGRLSVV